MSAIDYAGRIFDLLALRGQAAVGERELAQSLFGDDSAGEICVGAQKLVQRWVLEFLTELGSMPFLPQRGASFMTAARQNWLRTEADVQAEFNFAVAETRQNLRAEETTDMPDDERFGNAVLTNLTLSPELLALHVTVTTLAGTERAVILPLSVVP